MTLETFNSLLFHCDKSNVDEVWPSLPTITEVTGDASFPLTGSPDYLVQSPDSSPNIVQDESCGSRFSSRLQVSVNSDTMEKASALSRKRNLEGNHDSAPNPLSSNSFAVLFNNQIVAKANLMGVKIPDGNFDTINLVRDLELARNSLGSKHKSVKPLSSVLFIESNEGTTTPLSMDWISSNDNDDSSFTLVESRKKKNMKRKSSVSASRPITRSQRNKKAESTNCALSPGRVSRTRSKPKKLQ
jgi:hypothetical protein